MPNHVTNRVRISVNGMGLEEFLRKLCPEDSEREVIDFEAIIPSPCEDPEDIEYKNSKYGGLPDWYAWRCEHWGTKWNAYDAYIEDTWEGGDSCELEIHFDTAWSPPFPIIEAIRAWPEVEGVWGHWVEEFAEDAGIF